ncbi:hypothetical protein SteCoe_10159 [Stentor coeruleus]|uniref:Uncharacterized protein n=1 Tax=Stentor coeruleus TaxID=5963 RepID=A0A1R2CG76_9CILI|nr:hypothetical protein SteCoe_10159 [Stentor coeruleus]
MFKRLAPVIELPESRSDSTSPVHKRSQTQHKSRFPSSPCNVNTQVWMIIQSRRNLDKKIRCMQSRVKSSREKQIPISGTINESPCNKSTKELQEGKNDLSILGKKRSELQNSNRLKKDKNNEIKEKISEKALKARNDIKMQSALDLEYIKKREEIIFQQKKEKVNSIKNSFKNAKHKRAISNQALREILTAEHLNKLHKLTESNKNYENAFKTPDKTQESPLSKIKSSSDLKENTSKCMPERSYSEIMSPRRNKF